jgi:hypothetical protein
MADFLIKYTVLKKLVHGSVQLEGILTWLWLWLWYWLARWPWSCERVAMFCFVFNLMTETRWLGKAGQVFKSENMQRLGQEKADMINFHLKSNLDLITKRHLLTEAAFLLLVNPCACVHTDTYTWLTIWIFYSFEYTHVHICTQYYTYTRGMPITKACTCYDLSEYNLIKTNVALTARWHTKVASRYHTNLRQSYTHHTDIPVPS